MDPVTAWIFCLVVAHFLQKWIQGASAQAAAEARRAGQQWAGEVRGRMDAALRDAGPGSSPWWWAGSAWRTWRGMRGPRPGSTRALPHASPWRRIAAAGWAHGRMAARQRWTAPRPAPRRGPGAGRQRTSASGGASGPRTSDPGGRDSRRARRLVMAACDRCSAIVAKESLQPVPVQAGGRTELWLMCVSCAAAARGEDPDRGAPGPEPWDLDPEDSWEQEEPAELDPAPDPDPADPGDGWSYSYGLAGTRMHSPAGSLAEALEQARGLSQWHETPMVVCAYPPGAPQPGQVIAAYQHRQPVDPAAVEMAWPLEIEAAPETGEEPDSYQAEVQAIQDGFQYENCEICGQGLEGHVIGPDPLGHAHAHCAEPVCGVCGELCDRGPGDEPHPDPGPDDDEPVCSVCGELCDREEPIANEGDDEMTGTEMSGAPGAREPVRIGLLRQDGTRWVEYRDGTGMYITEKDDTEMTGTDLARGGGESYTHGQWEQVTTQIAQVLDELVPQLENMLGSLNAAEAGRSQTAGVMTLYDRTMAWAGQVRAMLAEITPKEAPVVEATTAAGGPDEIPGIPYLEEV